jgi:3-hydroxyacyl-CoA dehydrogenase
LIEVRNAVVVGAGVMGSGIAQTLAVAGCTVWCSDLDEEQLERASRSVLDGRYGLSRAVERGHLSAADAEAAGARLHFVPDMKAALEEAHLVIEAIPEDIGAKQRLFEMCDRIAPAGAIFATNTSGLSVEAIASATGRPARCVGWHWASPAQIMALAEIVVTKVTDSEVVDTVVDLASRCGKNPVVVKDNPETWGHVGNRIYAAAIAEAAKVIEEGLTDQRGVDRIMMDAFRWPAGPFGMVTGAKEGWGG